VVEGVPTDQRGVLEPLDVGDVVLSVPSPESLRREPENVRRVVDGAGAGSEPLVIEIEAAEELRADELAALVEAARDAPRTVLVRVLREV
jgi:hypothetical protein